MIALFPLLRLFDVTSIPILILATIGGGFASGLCMPLTYGIQADNTDYVNLKMNVHASGGCGIVQFYYKVWNGNRRCDSGIYACGSGI